jgi:hypothetical protein
MPHVMQAKLEAKYPPEDDGEGNENENENKNKNENENEGKNQGPSEDVDMDGSARTRDEVAMETDGKAGSQSDKEEDPAMAMEDYQ